MTWPEIVHRILFGRARSTRVGRLWRASWRWIVRGIAAWLVVVSIVMAFLLFIDRFPRIEGSPHATIVLYLVIAVALFRLAGWPNRGSGVSQPPP